MNSSETGNLTLLTDLYELTMMQGYFFFRRDLEAVFDMFYRREPFSGGYAVFAGLEPFVKTLLNFRFTGSDLSYLEGLGLFKPRFLDYLSRFSFRGDIDAAEEGEVVFAREPLVRVRAGIIEAQFLESILLNMMNFQTLIATKAARIASLAPGRAVLEFGLRRAQGVNGALAASRAAYIGGAASTSNVLAGRLFSIPTAGTMAHSWVMAFSSERESFMKYAALYPESTILLVDTYNTLERGLPAAIKVLTQLKKGGSKRFGIRLDSGDLDYLSKRARSMLDAAGLQEASIVASNELDEYVIEELMSRKAPIDYFGVGTKLVTAGGSPALDGIYKLVACREKNGRFVPRIKISNNPEKATNPSVKNVLRLYGGESPLGDIIFLENERAGILRRSSKKLPLMFYHPEFSFEQLAVSRYTRSKVLLRPVIRGGKQACDFPELKAVREKARRSLAGLDPSYRRLLNPHVYKVSVTRKLRDMKLRLITAHTRSKGEAS